MTALDRIGPSESQAIADAELRARRRQYEAGQAQKAEERAIVREHEASAMRAGKGSMPRTLDGLLHWYTVAIEMEKPAILHSAAIWHTRQRYDDEGKPVVPPEEVGGSELGTRAWADAFRRTLENGPHELDDDGYYVRPLASALARMRSGNRDRPACPLTVQRLIFLGFNPGEWRNLCDAMKLEEEGVAIYLHRALEMLWLIYRDRPTVHR